MNQIRNPKLENRKKAEFRKPNRRRPATGSPFENRISDFEFQPR